MTEKEISKPTSPSRRTALKTLALGAGAASLPLWARYAQAHVFAVEIVQRYDVVTHDGELFLQ